MKALNVIPRVAGRPSIWSFVHNHLSHESLTLDTPLPDADLYYAGFEGQRMPSGALDFISYLSSSKDASGDNSEEKVTALATKLVEKLLMTVQQLKSFEEYLDARERDRRRKAYASRAASSSSASTIASSNVDEEEQPNPVEELYDFICSSFALTSGTSIVRVFHVFATEMAKAVEVAQLRELESSQGKKKSKKQTKRLEKRSDDMLNPLYQFDLLMLQVLGLALAFDAPDRAAVKIGLSVLSILPPGRIDADVYERVLMFGACEEFTFFCARVLFQTIEWPEDALVALAQVTKAYGRVMLVNLLAQIEPLSLQTRLWLVREGHLNLLSIYYTAYTVLCCTDPKDLCEEHKLEREEVEGLARCICAVCATAGRPEGTFGWKELASDDDSHVAATEEEDEDEDEDDEQGEDDEDENENENEHQHEHEVETYKGASDGQRQEADEVSVPSSDAIISPTAVNDAPVAQSPASLGAFAEGVLHAFMSVADSMVDHDRVAGMSVPEGGFDVDTLLMSPPATEDALVPWIEMAFCLAKRFISPTQAK